MAALQNPKHETFAQELLKGTSAAKAYVIAGYKEHRQNASALARQKPILARVTELQAEREHQDREATERATASLALTKEWVLERLRENVERSMQAAAVLDPKGNPTGEYRYEGNVANRALELIGKELRMFRDKVEVSADESLASLITQAMTRPKPA